MTVDVRDLDALAAWLGVQPPEIVMAVVARSSLRSFLLVEEHWFSSEKDNGLVLKLLRAISSSWCAAKYPVQVNLIAHYASYDISSSYASEDAILISNGVKAVFQLQDHLNHELVALGQFGHRVTSLAWQERLIGKGYKEDIFAVFDNDINTPFDARGMIDFPLWSKGLTDFPNLILNHIEELWVEIKFKLLSINPNWHVWTDWYEARLYPDKFPTPNKELELARAMIPNEIWDQGWEVVNPEIERLIAEHTKEPELRSEDGGVPASIARDMSGRSLVVCTPLETCENVVLLSVALPWTGSNAVPDPLDVISNFEGDVFDLSRCEKPEDLLAFLVDGAPDDIDKQNLYDEVSAALDGGQASVYFGSIESLLADALKNVGAESLKGYAKLSDRQFRVGLIRKGKSIIFITLVLGGSAIVVKSSYDIAGAYVEHITSELKKTRRC